MSSARPRTVLQVSKTDEGDVDISLLTDAHPVVRQNLVIKAGDVVTLIDMLRHYADDGDPEDRSTLRNLKPVR